MPTTIRIINDPPNAASFNMAADLFLLEQCRVSNIIYLRVYRWSPPAISLGYRENPEKTLDFEAMERDGIDWIRRSTGGRAVLHDEDITYSIIFPKGITGMGGSIPQTYNLISQCLQDGFRRCGIRSSSHDSAPDIVRERTAVRLPCFLAPNRDEIMVGNKKMVGSAQKRTAHAVLQHGSIPYTDAYRNLPDYLLLPAEQRNTQKRILARKCACVREIAPSCTQETVVDNLIQGFVQTLPFNPQTENWNRKEKEIISAMARSDAFAEKWKSLHKAHI
ncbi:MAG: hypothetical protein GF401_18480 [Chitinivibrionales bacterium]|nr:hypothetical protein [Chitinivibrionales bacterium]